jgi:hypothetical protein
MRWTSYLLAIGLGACLAVLVFVAVCLVKGVPERSPVSVVKIAAPVEQTKVVNKRKEPRPEVPRYKQLDAAGMAKLLGGSQVESALRQPDKVTSVLLAAKILPERIPPSQLAARTMEVEVAPELAARLAETLLDPQRNRQINGVKPCVTRYGWKVSFIRGEEQIDLYFCFECAILAVYQGDKFVGGSHIDEIIEELLAIATTLFPGDPALLEQVEHERKRQEAIARALSGQSDPASLKNQQPEAFGTNVDSSRVTE